ncbi:type VII toxin-antitoxin system HepT family RNase toxin [Lentibacillus salicampi]|uniref:DUF86 domain-containing protein n=1 Tax=Lentibacillus salicampi TaxID=175306 RepID=A0A4Y9AG91_9BACI|nr:DUF86 domain-containing protein [Lentibacillus salicampi]TFJ93394.1 DUF86 domain-containing protein [Lentibacillus salicampi]
MTNDVILDKVSIIERCVRRIEEVYDNDPASLDDFTKLDSITLNIQRACEAAIDLSMHIVAEKKLGLPQKSREAFDLLQDTGVISGSTAARMKAMVGFRNIAVHSYQDIDHDILKKIVNDHIDDFKTFTRQVLHNVG